MENPPIVTKNVYDPSCRSTEDGRLIVAGALRNTEGSWNAIQDERHQPRNIASVETNAFTVTVRFPFDADRIVSLVATPDEVLAARGTTVGASVRTGEAVLTFAEPGIGGHRRISPQAIDAPFSNIWLYGEFIGVCSDANSAARKTTLPETGVD